MFLLSLITSLLVNSVFGQNNTIQTGCYTPICVFSNPNLRFGSGSENSINNAGLFVQPWYYSYISNTWYKLTYSAYPLDTAIGTGFGSSHWSGSNIVDLYSLSPSNIQNDYSNYIVSSQDSSKTVGYGKIIARRSFILNSNNIIFENTFSLGRNDSFVKVNTRIINNSSNTINNVLIWVGTRDDYVGLTDVNTKTRGNLINGNFTAITANYQESHAIMITNTNEGVLFYSETPSVMTAYSSCCSFSNVYNTNPLSILPATPNPTDGSYAVVLPLGNISFMSSGNIVWYYAAGATSSLSNVAQSVAIAQVADVIIPSLSLSPTIEPYSVLTGSINSSISPSNIPSNSFFISPSNIPSVSMFVSPSYIKTFSTYMTPSSLFSLSSTQTTTPNSYETQTSTQSKSPIIPDKVLNVQLNNDIISNFIIINVVSIFIIFGLICISLCCVYVIILYRKKNYCDECKKELDEKYISKKELNPANLKLTFVQSTNEDDVISSDEDIVISTENKDNNSESNNIKLPNSID